MSEIDINQLLGEMRTMAAKAAGGAEIVVPEADRAADFAAMLRQSIDKVNALQMEAGGKAKAFEMGDPQIDLAEVMVSLQKASVSFEAMTQVRNKLLSAYQDIMNMPI